MPMRSAAGSWQDMVRHVRTYLRKRSPGKGLDLDMSQSQGENLKSSGCSLWGGEHEVSVQPDTEKIQDAAMYSE